MINTNHVPDPWNACKSISKVNNEKSTKNTNNISGKKYLIEMDNNDATKCRKKLKIRRERHRQNKIFRMFKIKNLDKTLSRDTHARENIPISRIFDNAIPIDRTFSETNYGEGKYYHPILGKLRLFKRITSIINHYDREEYEYKIEERFAQFKNQVINSDKNPSFVLAGNLLSLLKNYNFEYTGLLYKYLEHSIAFAHLDSYNGHLFHPIDKSGNQAVLFPSFDELEKEYYYKNKQQKIPIIKQSLSQNDDAMLDEIKSLPYIKIIEKVNALDHQITSHLLGLYHNKYMLDILGFEFIRLSGQLQGFEVFNC